MARIRSLHPGQWSDEDFVSLTFPARLLALGVRNLADDHGVFEWKPLTLKMQLFPADNVDLVPLLDELKAANVVTRYELNGRQFGAVRNFMRWQRPKKPSYSHPTSEAVLEYVGLNAPKSGTDDASGDASSEPVGNQFRTGGEKSPQRKEEGGRREKKEGRKKDPPASRSADAAGAQPPPTPSPAAEVAPPATSSAEDRFWALAPAFETKGVGRSMLGKLANLLNGDFVTGVSALQDALAARTPRQYLAKITRNLEQTSAMERAAATDADLPRWVAEARMGGYPVEREGEHWRFGAGLYDDDKLQVGA